MVLKTCTLVKNPPNCDSKADQVKIYRYSLKLYISVTSIPAPCRGGPRPWWRGPPSCSFSPRPPPCWRRNTFFHEFHPQPENWVKYYNEIYIHTPPPPPTVRSIQYLRKTVPIFEQIINTLTSVADPDPSLGSFCFWAYRIRIRIY